MNRNKMESNIDHTPATELHLAYLYTTADINDLDIKKQETVNIIGETATINIIGSSHYIEIPNIDFYEILSCKPITTNTSHQISLTETTDQTINRDINNTNVEVTVTPRKLAFFDETETYDIQYKFSENAFTAINVKDNGVYESYHTYPEFNLTLQSKHKITKKNRTPPRS